MAKTIDVRCLDYGRDETTAAISAAILDTLRTATVDTTWPVAADVFRAAVDRAGYTTAGMSRADMSADGQRDHDTMVDTIVARFAVVGVYRLTIREIAAALCRGMEITAYDCGGVFDVWFYDVHGAAYVVDECGHAVAAV